MGTYSAGHFFSNFMYLSKVITKKPIFFARLANNYRKLLFERRRPPLRFVDVAVTYECTMSCAHCSTYGMARENKKLLAVSEYEKIAGKLLRAGMLAVNFTGGEPLCRKDFYDIVRAFQPEKVLVSVQTNASIMTEERLLQLREIGVDSIGVSIDSADEEIHDRFRNYPGAFSKALKALEMGNDMGFNMGVSYCLTRENLYSDDRVKIVEMSKKYRALLNYNLAVPIGRWNGELDKLIRPEDRRHLLKILDAYKWSKTDFETNYFKKGCGAIKEKLYINPYGDVMPCPFIQIGFGNILYDDVEDVRSAAFQYKYFKDYALHCLAAEDVDFIRNSRCYSKDVYCSEVLPIPHDRAFINRKDAL